MEDKKDVMKEKENITEEKSDNKQKKKFFSDKKNILIVLLIIAIIGLSGYICYDTGLFGKGNDLTTQKEEKQEEKVEDDKEEIKEEIKTKTDEPLERIAVDSTEVSTAMKLFKKVYIAANLYDPKGYNIENMSNSELVGTAVTNIDSSYVVSDCAEKQDRKPVSYDMLNSVLKKYVLDKTITKQTIESLEKTTSTDKGNNEGESYYAAQGIIIEVAGDSVKLHGPCDGNLSFDFDEKKLIAAEKNNEYLYVYEKVAFGDVDDPFESNLVVRYYKDKNHKEFVKTGLKDWNAFNTYKYTFKIANNSYYFQKYELSDK